MLDSFFSGKKMPIGRLLLIFLMLLIVVLGGTFAWLTYASKKSALVLTIGDINDTQIKLSPYQVTGTIAPGTTYTSGVYSNVEINKGNNNFASFSLFYKINTIDVVLIDKGLSYTVINTLGTDSVDDDVTVKTGRFSDLIDTSEEIPDEVVIMSTEENASLSANTVTYYKVYLWVNSSVGNQDDVQGTTLNVELNASISTMSNTGSFGVQLINNRTEDDNLSDDLVGGMYRYQGTDEEVTNNYVCFGTSDKNECLSDKSTYMYRIIGVDQFGYIKTIKADSLDPMVVSSSPYSTVNWHNADLSVSLNGSGFLNNLTELPEGWSEKIATYSWPYGRIDAVPLENNTTGYEWYAQENGNSAWTDRFEGKIGLMYINDYIYAASSGTVTPEQRVASWIHITNTAYSTLNVSYYVREHLMTWTDNVYEDKWYTTAGIKLYQDTATGVVGSIFEWYALAGYYRPVFYMDSTVQKIGGSGTETDPYIIAEQNVTGTYTINYYNGSELLDSEEHTIGVAAPLMSWADLGGDVGGYADHNWEFAGWNISSDSYEKRYNDGQNVVNLSLIHGDEVNLYAIYSRPVNFYTTIPDVDGGGTPSTVTIQYWNPLGTTTSENMLSPVSLPLIPETNGWNAVGYSNVTTENYGDYGFGYFSSNNQSWLDFEYIDYDYYVDFYASYYKNYTINFNANGGTGTMDSVSGLMSHNLYYAQPTVELVTVPSNEFTKPGYLFNGWVDSEGNVYDEGDDFQPSVDDYNMNPLEYTFNATWWDGIAPTGVLNASSSDSSVSISFTNVVEEGSGVDYYLFFMDNDNDPSISYEHEGVNSNYTFMNVPAGTYTVTAYIIDKEGNESEYTKTITVNLSDEYYNAASGYFVLNNTASDYVGSPKLRVTWHQEYNPSTQKSIVYVDNLEMYATVSLDIFWVGGSTGDGKGVTINDNLIELTTDYGGTYFNYNLSANTWQSLCASNPLLPWSSGEISHTNGTTLTIPILIDLWLVNDAGTSSIKFYNLSTDVTLTTNESSLVIPDDADEKYSCDNMPYTVNYYNGTTFLDYSEHYTGQAQNLLSWDDDLGGDLGEYYDYNWEFAGWSTDPDSYVVEYSDAESVVNLTNVDSGEVDLYAVYSREVNFYESSTTVTATSEAAESIKSFLGSDTQYWNSYEFSTDENDGNLSSVSAPLSYSGVNYVLDDLEFRSGEPIILYPRTIPELYIEYDSYRVQYLFNQGDDYHVITGGWINEGWTNNTYTMVDNASVNNGFLHSYVDSNYTASIIGTANKVNLTNYTKLYACVTDYYSNPGVGGVAVSIDKDFHTQDASTTTQIGMISMDISSLNDSYYIGVKSVTGNTSPYAAGIYVSKIWLVNESDGFTANIGC